MKKIESGSFASVVLGINGTGRIGKLLAWYLIKKQFFGEIVVSLGRTSGKNLNDFIENYFETDSTYGGLGRYLDSSDDAAVSPIQDLQEINATEGTFMANGVKVRVLLKERKPELIDWAKYGVKLVVDTTGKFLDPSKMKDEKNGCLVGHLSCGAQKVIVSAPFKIGDKSSPSLAKTTTIIAGINDDMYDPNVHSVISTASCTTTCLAHLLNPLWKEFGSKINSFYMNTVHAVTSSQPTLDRAPKSDASDLRKTRSILNNIILTSTGAAKALPLVISGVKNISFGANSIRVPTNTGSLVVLILTLAEMTDAKSVNSLLEAAAKNDSNHYLVYSNRQNVSADIIGKRAACIVEAQETRVIAVPGQKLSNVIVYGWYDNEYGYMAMMTEVVRRIAAEFLPV